MEDINVIQPKVTAEIPVTSADIPKSNISDADIGMMLLKQEFQIELANKQDSDQLKWMYNFYEKQGVKDMDEVLRNLQLIKTKIGTAPYGVTPLQHVYQYLKVLSQMGQLERIKKGMENGI